MEATFRCSDQHLWGFATEVILNTASSIRLDPGLSLRQSAHGLRMDAAGLSRLGLVAAAVNRNGRRGV